MTSKIFKPGNLVYFSAIRLAYDYEILRNQYGLLLEQLDIDLKPDYIERCWITLFGEKKVVVYESDMSLVEHD